MDVGRAMETPAGRQTDGDPVFGLGIQVGVLLHLELTPVKAGPDRTEGRMPQKPEDQVQGLDPLVHQGAAARLVGQLTPCGPNVPNLAIQPGGLDGGKLSQLATGDEGPQRGHVRAEPVCESDHQRSLRGGRSFHDPSCPFGREGERPLHQDVFPLSQGAQGEFFVAETRSADHHAVDVLGSAEGLVVDDTINAESTADRARLQIVGVGDGHHIHVVALGQNGEVNHLGNGPGTGQAHSDTLSCTRHQGCPLETNE